MACIVDQSGKYMAHTNMAMTGRTFLGDTGDPLETAILDEIGQQPFGTVRSKGYPPEMIAGFYKLEQVPWTMILFARGDKILKPIIAYRNSFGRYVDPELARMLLEHPEASKLGGKRREVAMMMSDILGFTALSDTMATTVLRCVHCAQRMQEAMSDFNCSMLKEDLPELAMGIGINAGQVIVGNIGSHTRSKYGIVGSAVNITSRIQARADKHEIVISPAVYDYLKGMTPMKRSFSATMKGVEQPMQLHVI